MDRDDEMRALLGVAIIVLLEEMVKAGVMTAEQSLRIHRGLGDRADEAPALLDEAIRLMREKNSNA